VITLAVFVVLVLATARITRAVSIDDITLPMRLSLGKRFGQASYIYELVICFWCSGWWISAATTAYTLAMLTWLHQLPGIVWWGYPIIFPAVAYAASWVLNKEVN
jgi:hypothetical protein